VHSDRDRSSEQSSRASSDKQSHSNGASPNPAVKLWRCPNCGQSYFGAAAPDMCDFCSDFTTWQLIVGPQADADEDTKPMNPDPAARSATQELNIQLRLIPDEEAADEDEHV
jgi:hypothetical protein